MRSESFPSTKIGRTCFVTEKISKSGLITMPDVNSNYKRYLMGKRNNGEGTFVTLTPNKIVHKICIGKKSNGKLKFLSVTGTTKADCKRKMKARLDTLNKSQNDINNIYKDTLTSLCKKHLASDISHKHMLKPKAADRRA